MSQGYEAPTKGDNAFSGYTGFRPDPYFFNHKKDLAGIGEAVDFRILRLDKTATLISEAREAVVTNQKTGAPMNTVVYYPGDEAAKEIVDRTGKRLCDCPVKNIFRMTVWIYGKHTGVVADQATKFEPINKLMYFEWTSGLIGELNKLNSTNAGSSPFDKKTGRPNYDIQLSVVKANSPSIPKNYKLSPIFINFGEDGIPVAHPNAGKVAEDVLVQFMGQIQKEWPIVTAAMLKTPSVEEIKRNFVNRSPQGSPSTSTPRYTEPTGAGIDDGVYRPGAAEYSFAE